MRSGDEPQRIAGKKDIAALDDMLTAVIDGGTGKRARLPIAAAGKTGTTQDHRDAWFAGFAGDYITVVWLGNDDNSPMNGVTGGGLPAQIWKKIMLEALKEH